MRLAALAVTGTLLLAGCGGESRAEAPEPSHWSGPPAVTALSPEPSADPALASFYGQRPAFQPCENGLGCARVEVPVDWTKPAGATISLALLRHPAQRPEQRIGTLFINPGGPGASGVKVVRSVDEVFSPALLDRYDIVGFDPRGVGESSPVRCLAPAALDAFLTVDQTPDDDAEVAALVSASAVFADACRQNTGALVSHVGTRDVARDLDVLRAALGEEKLTYLGFSYGSYLGAFYAGMFPTRVGRLVLDGALDPSLPAAELLRSEAESFQSVLDRLAAYCLREECPIGDSPARVAEEIVALLAELDARPLRVGSRTLTESDALSGIAYALYTPALWDRGIDALDDALGGDGGELLALADDLLSRTGPGAFEDNSNEANYLVNCLDHHPGEQLIEVAAATARAALPELTRASKVFGPQIAWAGVACAHLPHSPTTAVAGPVRAAGAAPILVVGTTHDPATPYGWAVALASQLDSGVLLTRAGDGHTGYGRGNRCIDAGVDRYLLEGKAPKDGTTCS
ncbi:MAG: alpha/beta hydrolase [Sporichthyaceae bacterium]